MGVKLMDRESFMSFVLLKAKSGLVENEASQKLQTTF